MAIFLNTLLLVLLFLIFLQDLKFRAIHIMLPVLIFIVGLYVFYQSNYDSSILLQNILFLVITFFGLYLYLVIKHKKLINPFHLVGIGDFLFFVAIIPYFSTANYILYFITGMLFSILSFLIIKLTSKTNLVPLAGLLALYMIILKGVFYFYQLDFIKTKLF